VSIRLWVAVCALAPLATPAPAAEPAGVRVGLIEGMFKDVPRPILNAMAEPFRSLLTRQTGLTGDVVICSSSHQLAGKLKDKTLSVGVFHGFEYAWAKHANADLVPLLVTIPHGRKVQAMVVVKADAEYKTAADLKNVDVVVPKMTKAHASLFFDKLRAKYPTMKMAPKPATMTQEEGLSAVAAGTEKAVLTDITALNGYFGLQPGAAGLLRVLVESEPFPVAVIATNKGTMTDTDLGRIRTGLGNASKTAQGRTMLTMWSLKGFEPPPSDFEQCCKNILVHYPPPAASPAEAVVTPNK
jgi:ABC-type phosphate/phosphonate transport system substrate-binding protein